VRRGLIQLGAACHFPADLQPRSSRAHLCALHHRAGEVLQSVESEVMAEVEVRNSGWSWEKLCKAWFDWWISMAYFSLPFGNQTWLAEKSQDDVHIQIILYPHLWCISWNFPLPCLIPGGY